AVGIPAPTRRIDVAEVQAGRTTRSLLVSGVGTELEHRSPHRGSWATGSGSHTPFSQWSPWESYAPGAFRPSRLAAVGTATTVSPSKRSSIVLTTSPPSGRTALTTPPGCGAEHLRSRQSGGCLLGPHDS